MKYMRKLDHPFIVKMHGVSQDTRNIYIMMDYLANGELLKVIQALGRMNTSCVRFYSAQVVSFFEYLHAKDLIYRDLKPENVLVQPNGYIKMTDFGFIKKLKPWDRTYTLCGTPEYMAPEVIMNVGHGRAADWYTLGIFMYELIVGRPPFMENDTLKVFQMVLRDQIPFPNGFNNDAKSLIRSLTSHDLSKRFGNLINGAEDIKKHRFFSKIDWKKLPTMCETAPYIPKPDKEAAHCI